MSLTGSLVNYENNNELNSKKSRSLLNTTNSSIGKPPCSSLNSSLNTSVATASSMSSTSPLIKGHLNQSGHGPSNSGLGLRERKSTKRKGRFHLNTLWSIWYGILFTILQGYLAIQGAHRFLICSLLQWKPETPSLELNIQIVLCGFVFVVLPLFLITAIFKVGNLANDGVKLGTSSGGNGKRCSADPHDGLEEESKGGTVRAIWTHGGPSAAFLHIVMGLSLLIPRLLIESRMIETGLLPKDFVWRTELDLFSNNPAQGNYVMTTISNSPYSNDSHVAIDNQEHRQSVSGVFDKTHLIDQFYSEDEIEESLFEKIEMDPDLDWHHSNGNPEQPRAPPMVQSEDLPPQKVLTTTSSTTTSAPTHVVPRARADDYEAESFEPQQPPSQHQPAKHNRKSKNKHHGHNGNRNRKAHHGGGQGGRRSKQQQQRRDPDYEDEFDSHLELKSERNVPFDKLNSYDMGPQSIQFEVNKNGRRQYQAQRPAHGDSDVHVVEPQNPETVTFSVDSKIIDIRPNRENSRRFKRDTAGQPSSAADTEQRNQNAFAAFLAKFFGVRALDVEPRNWMAMPALEFLNFVVAIMVWSVRYPSVFWATSKPFSIIFLVQMVANAFSIVYDYLGTSILYKLQVVNEAAGIKSGTLLLNALVTISLLLLSVLLILGSSHILYMYGHGKLSLKMRERKVISVKSSQAWIYFAHCSSLCFVLALAVVKAPLLHDLTMTYRENLNGTLFASALISVCQLFVWVVLWLGLTAKRRWAFKLPQLQQQHSHQNQGSAIHPGKQKILNGLAAGNVTEPLLARSPPPPLMDSQAIYGVLSSPVHQNMHNVHQMDGGEEIYWPKLQPNSPKMKVTFNEVTSMSSPSTSTTNTDPNHQNYALACGAEHGGKRGKTRGAQVCVSGVAREAYGDDGDYAVLRGGPITDLRQLSDFPPPCDSHLTDDNTSEEGKLLECVRDDSVTYASTRDLEPPGLPPPPPPLLDDSNNNSSGYASQLVSPLAPVTVTVHTNEAHITSNMTPRCLRRADSGMAGEALLTPSTESSASPPDRAPSETSSGVHSGEERDEVVIRSGSCGSRPSPYKPSIKPVPPPIAEEPFGRSTNMRMSSFNINNNGSDRHSHQSLTGSTSVNNNMGLDCAQSSATLPLLRSGSSLVDYHPMRDYPHCSTMPLPGSNGPHNSFMDRQQQSMMGVSSSSTSAQSKHLNQLNNNNNISSNGPSPSHSPFVMPQHTTLPNGVRYANPMLTRRVPHLKNADSPYGVLGLGSGHHTFSKLMHDPLLEIEGGDGGGILDSTNYAIISEEMYIADVTGSSGGGTVTGSNSSNYVALPPPMDNNNYANNNNNHHHHRH